MNDAELIAEGRKLVRDTERDQLTLGRLALDYAPIGDPGVKTGAYDRLQEYADAIGADAGTLRNYRATWAGWRHCAAIGDHGFTVLKALLSVADKDGLLAAMAEQEPPTKSGRWTASAAVDFAREHGFWSHDGGAYAMDILSVLGRMRAALARLDTAELSYEEITKVITVLGEFRAEIEALHRTLSPRMRPARSRA